VSWERTGLSLDDLEPLLPLIQAQFNEAKALLGAR